MREQITIKLPKRVGVLISEGIVDSIHIKKDHKDIMILIDDTNTIDYNNGEMEVKLK